MVGVYTYERTRNWLRRCWLFRIHGPIIEVSLRIVFAVLKQRPSIWSELPCLRSKCQYFCRPTADIFYVAKMNVCYPKDLFTNYKTFWITVFCFQGKLAWTTFKCKQFSIYYSSDIVEQYSSTKSQSHSFEFFAMDGCFMNFHSNCCMGLVELYAFYTSMVSVLNRISSILIL